MQGTRLVRRMMLLAAMGFAVPWQPALAQLRLSALPNRPPPLEPWWRETWLSAKGAH